MHCPKSTIYQALFFTTSKKKSVTKKGLFSTWQVKSISLLDIKCTWKQWARLLPTFIKGLEKKRNLFWIQNMLSRTFCMVKYPTVFSAIWFLAKMCLLLLQKVHSVKKSDIFSHLKNFVKSICSMFVSLWKSWFHGIFVEKKKDVE